MNAAPGMTLRAFVIPLALVLVVALVFACLGLLCSWLPCAPFLFGLFIILVSLVVGLNFFKMVCLFVCLFVNLLFCCIFIRANMVGGLTNCGEVPAPNACV